MYFFKGNALFISSEEIHQCRDTPFFGKKETCVYVVLFISSLFISSEEMNECRDTRVCKTIRHVCMYFFKSNTLM